MIIDKKQFFFLSVNGDQLSDFLNILKAFVIFVKYERVFTDW